MEQKLADRPTSGIIGQLIMVSGLIETRIPSAFSRWECQKVTLA
ncbi:hypothetical protein [Anabaena azotica]|nr:hypothetical protein [Anabaena azotica]